MVSMRFEEVVRGRTRTTQRLWLDGEGAEALLDGVRLFETTTPDVLKRIPAVIERARRKTSDSER
jgi:hypothetical protein